MAPTFEQGMEKRTMAAIMERSQRGARMVSGDTAGLSSAGENGNYSHFPSFNTNDFGNDRLREIVVPRLAGLGEACR